MTIDRALSVIPVLFAGAIFGFFYAFVCTVMWGLDTLDPSDAIVAMNGINSVVQNGVFGASFFGTPLVCLAIGAVLWARGQRPAAALLGLAAVVYVAGAMVPTFVFNVPMNRDLLAVPADVSPAEARAIWTAYSPDWQFWNTARTVMSGLVLGLAGSAIAVLRP